MQLLEVVTFILYDQLCTDNLYTVNYPSVQILKSLLKDVKTVINSELEWEIKYNIVFSETLSGKTYKELENIDVKFDYYDRSKVIYFYIHTFIYIL